MWDQDLALSKDFLSPYLVVCLASIRAVRAICRSTAHYKDYRNDRSLHRISVQSLVGGDVSANRVPGPDLDN